MSTNYFAPPTYINRPAVRPPAFENPLSASLPAVNPNWSTVTGWTPGNPNTAAPNQGQIQTLIAGLYGSGTQGQPGYIEGLNARAAREFGAMRNNARDALRGYGGVSFRQDDPSTPNVDESLMAEYQPDKLGTREREAVLAARQQANASGMMFSGFGDKMVGSALQRVGEEARQIVNQYASQINQLSKQYFDPLTGLASTTLQQIQSLYGSDMQWQANQAMQKPPDPAPTPPPAPPPPPPPPPPELPQAGESQVWRGTNPPNMTTLRNKYPNMNLRVQLISPQGAPPRYVVFATPR